MRVFTVRTIGHRARLWAGGLAVSVAGCASPDGGPPLLPTPAPGPFAYNYARPSSPVAPLAARPPTGAPPIRQASFQNPAPPGGAVPSIPAAVAPSGVDDFVRLAVERNPRLARANLAIEAARGRHLQAGLYPNPEVAVNWDELGDRSSPDRLGILTAPKISQTIVTGKKLTLAQAVAAREVDQATLELLGERFAVVGSVRAAFYEAFALQRRADLLAELANLADEAVAKGKVLLDTNPPLIARLDYLQLEVERERYRAELQAVQNELPGAYRRLAAVAGNNGAIPASVAGTFDGLPEYNADAVREAVLAHHPQSRSARVGVQRAQAAVRRAEAEPIPNVSVYAGYIRQFENRSHDGAVGLSMPVPVWNRNQGNIRAAKAELGMAIQMVSQTENDLAAQVALTFQTYAAARARAAAYQKDLIPRAEETQKLSLAAFKGGQFDYLKVIQAQRAVAEARLELNKSLGEAWRSAAELSGLLLEESWPAAPPGPGAGPVMLPPLPPGGAKGP